MVQPCRHHVWLLAYAGSLVAPQTSGKSPETSGRILSVKNACVVSSAAAFLNRPLPKPSQHLDGRQQVSEFGLQNASVVDSIVGKGCPRLRAYYAGGVPLC